MSEAATTERAATADGEGDRARPRVGMVGGGQLARMTQQAAVDLDIELSVLDPDPSAGAVKAGARHFRGDPESVDDLRRFAAECDVVTFDHEGVSQPALRTLEDEGFALRPGAQAKRFAQDKLFCREAMQADGMPLPVWAAAETADEVRAHGERWGWPLVLKRPTGGYDGRGVSFVDGPDDVDGAFEELQPDGPVLVEEHVEIVRELAVLVARRPSGDAVVYPVVETTQRDGICREVVAPAGCGPETAEKAASLGMQVAELVGAAGILCVELFETPRGLIVNELALRPHNSGHITLDAFETSQFENHLRAVLDLPLGGTRRIVPAASMVNLLGPSDGTDPADRLPAALEVSSARVRLYGKSSKPGRKLGHVTAVGDDVRTASKLAWEATGLMSDA